MDALFTVYPLCYHPGLELKPEEEASNKFYASSSQFGELVKDAEEGELILYELKTPAGTVVATPVGPHYEEENILFVPTWMWNRLKGDGDVSVTCVLERCHPSMASMISLEPHTSMLLACKDPETALRNAFEQYSCIQRGETYPLQLEDLPELLWVTIPAVAPESAAPLCIRNIELTVDMLPARDAAAAAAAPLPPAMGGAGAPSPPPVRSVGKFANRTGFTPFSGTGNTIGGKKEA
jgi:hypothetical protein